MTEEHLIKAIDEIDDGLIAEAAQYRTVGKNGIKWIIPLATAAVICIIFSAFWKMGGLDWIPQNSESLNGNSENDVYYSVMESQKTENSTMENTGEVPSLIVTVDSWMEDGFIAIATEFVDTEVIPLGSTLYVKTDDATAFYPMIYDFESHTEKLQIDASTTSNAVYRIMFRFSDSDLPSVMMDDATGVYYVYAEQVFCLDQPQ